MGRQARRFDSSWLVPIGRRRLVLKNSKRGEWVVSIPRRVAEALVGHGIREIMVWLEIPSLFRERERGEKT